MKLTQANVAKVKLPAGKSDHIEWDESLPGFGLRVRAGGSKFWVVQYKIGGKHRRITLGKASELTADQARNGWEVEGKKHSGAAIILANAGHGLDAAATITERRSKAANTFGVHSTDYLAFQEPRCKPRYYEELARFMNVHWKPLHGLTLDSIKRDTVAARLRVIAKERGNVAADRSGAALSGFFGWSIREGLCEHNPAMHINKFEDEDERVEARPLTDAELAKVWNAAPENEYGKILRLLILTGQRREEIGGLRWSEIDFDNAMIHLPAERTKNKLPHDVPLTPMAVAILKSIPEREGRDLVFGSGEGGYSGWSRSKTVLDKACGVTGWRLHWLRHTADTRMHDIGVLPHIVEAVVNHVSGHKGGVAGLYNHAKYNPEKLDALTRWETYLKTALAKAAGGNVTRLQRA